MKNLRKNTLGFSHHALLGVVVVAIIVFAGYKVLVSTNAQIPADSVNIGDAVSFTPTVDQLQTLDALKTTASSADSATSSEKQLLTLNGQVRSAINSFRTAQGLKALSNSPALNASARQHSMEMGKEGYFGHNSADGTVWWKRIKQYYTSANYSYWTVGENLIYDTPSITASKAMKRWIASPEHKHNLLNPNWRNLGVSSVQVTNAPGVYQGYNVTIITTDFGARH